MTLSNLPSVQSFHDVSIIQEPPTPASDAASIKVEQVVAQAEVFGKKPPLLTSLSEGSSPRRGNFFKKRFREARPFSAFPSVAEETFPQEELDSPVEEAQESTEKRVEDKKHFWLPPPLIEPDLADRANPFEVSRPRKAPSRSVSFKKPFLEKPSESEAEFIESQPFEPRGVSTDLFKKGPFSRRPRHLSPLEIPTESSHPLTGGLRPQGCRLSELKKTAEQVELLRERASSPTEGHGFCLSAEKPFVHSETEEEAREACLPKNQRTQQLLLLEAQRLIEALHQSLMSPVQAGLGSPTYPTPSHSVTSLSPPLEQNRIQILEQRICVLERTLVPVMQILFDHHHALLQLNEKELKQNPPKEE